MWYTMEMLSGWPSPQRVPGLTCSDIEIDCNSSFICTVLLEYRGLGPMVHFGEDHDREIAAECLISQCPKEAALAEAVIEGRPGAKCPRTHFSVGMTKTTTMPPAPLPPALLPPAVLHTTIAPAPNGVPSAPCITAVPVVPVATAFPCATVTPGVQGGTGAPAAPLGLASPCATVAPSSNDGPCGTVAPSSDSGPWATVAPLTSKIGRSDLATGNVTRAGATVQPVDAQTAGQPSLSMLILLVVAGVVATLAAVAKVCEPRSSSAAREVLLPPAAAWGDHIEELEAMQETTTIAINDAE